MPLATSLPVERPVRARRRHRQRLDRLGELEHFPNLRAAQVIDVEEVALAGRKHSDWRRGAARRVRKRRVRLPRRDRHEARQESGAHRIATRDRREICAAALRNGLYEYTRTTRYEY